MLRGEFKLVENIEERHQLAVEAAGDRGGMAAIQYVVAPPEEPRSQLTHHTAPAIQGNW